jgi:hypothetical protein
MVSVSTFPYTIAPKKPLPTGKAFSQTSPEGLLYHSFRSCCFCEKQSVIKNSKATNNTFFIFELYVKRPGDEIIVYIISVKGFYLKRNYPSNCMLINVSITFIGLM